MSDDAEKSAPAVGRQLPRTELCSGLPGAGWAHRDRRVITIGSAGIAAAAIPPPGSRAAAGDETAAGRGRGASGGRSVRWLGLGPSRHADQRVDVRITECPPRRSAVGGGVDGVSGSRHRPAGIPGSLHGVRRGAVE